MKHSRVLEYVRKETKKLCELIPGKNPCKGEGSYKSKKKKVFDQDDPRE